MTPEEIAQKIIDDVPYSDEGSLYAGFPNLLWVQAHIAQAIRDAYERAAVAAEGPGDWECQGAAERIRALKGLS